MVSVASHTDLTQGSDVLHRDMVRSFVQEAGSLGATVTEIVDALAITRSSAGTRLVELCRENSVRETSRRRGGYLVYMHNTPTTYTVVHKDSTAAVSAVRRLHREIRRTMNNLDNPALAKILLEDALQIGADLVE